MLAILPPLLGVAWIKYSAWRAEQGRKAAMERVRQAVSVELTQVLEIEGGPGEAAPQRVLLIPSTP